MGIRRGVASLTKKRIGVRAASSAPSDQGDQIRGAGPIEKGLNQLGLLWHRNFAVFDFAKHAEIKTDKDLDHISAGEESSQTQTGNVLTHDKLCKWFTVEGLPGSGRADFAEKFCEATGVKNWGAGHLLWELERLKAFGWDKRHQEWSEMYEQGMHYLKMREVDVEKFFADPTDPVHSNRMQDHMKLQRHIHSMDALRHLLTTAEGVMTNRTFHSDYCFAYAMMKMGYMSKNFYEMRYTVSQATADGSNTATDLTPNISFFIETSPEEAFEHIKARGNEAEIKTCNLDFLKYVDEAYRTFWSEDMNNKGCLVVSQKKNADMDDLVDWIATSDESELRHQYSRWAYAHEKQMGFNNRSRVWGEENAIFDFLLEDGYNRFRRTKSPWTAWIYPGGMAGNFYEKVLQCDLTQGPHYSYKIMHTFQPWQELAESESMKFNYMMLNDSIISDMLCTGTDHHGITSSKDLDAFARHPDWEDDGSFGQQLKIMFGSNDKYTGDEWQQRFTYQKML